MSRHPTLPTGPLSASEEAELLHRARSQDRHALSLLLQAHQSGVRATIRALVGHPKDLEDILQDALLDAFTRLEELPPGARFSDWLQGLAIEKAGAFLALARRFRPAAQLELEAYCAKTETTADVAAIFGEDGFSFDVRSHVAFCFTAIGRSLPMEEQFAIVLVDVLGLSLDEAAAVQRLNTDSLTRYLQNARTNLELLFERLCGLSNEANPCDLCRGLRAVAADERKGTDPDRLGLNSGPPDERLSRRLRIVSQADLDHGPTRALHDFLFELMSQNETNRETPKEKDERLPSERSHWEDLQTYNN